MAPQVIGQARWGHCRCGAVQVWRCGAVRVWRCAGVELCRCGGVELCRCGGVEVCRCGGVQVWSSAGVEVCRCGCAGVQVWSCAGVELCRCGGVELCRCASARNGPLPKAVGPRLGRMPRGPPARPRQLAPGMLCCKPGPRAPLWGELWLLSFGPSFPSPPGLLSLPGRNSGSANRALCRLPGLPGLDTEQWQGL